MSIAGLDDEPIRLGRFKNGEKDERGLPKALKYWKIEGPGAEAVKSLYGENPTSVSIYLPGPLGPQLWDGSYRRYVTNGLACSGNGEEGYERQRTGPNKVIPCAQRGCPYAQPTTNAKGERVAPRCAPIFDLTFVAVGTERLGGTFKLSVRGLPTIREFNTFLKVLQADSGGDLSGVPFNLTFNERTGAYGSIAYPTLSRIPSAKRVKVQVAVKAEPEVFIPDDEFDEIEEEAQETVATPTVNRAALGKIITDIISKNYVAGKDEREAVKALEHLRNMEPQDLEAIYDWANAIYQEISETGGLPAIKFEADAAMYKYVKEQVIPDQLTTLKRHSPEELTRIEVRKLAREMLRPKEEA